MYTLWIHFDICTSKKYILVGLKGHSGYHNWLFNPKGIRLLFWRIILTWLIFVVVFWIKQAQKIWTAGAEIVTSYFCKLLSIKMINQREKLIKNKLLR
jgi:hypothetical protein